MSAEESRTLAEAVFADPDLRARFEGYAERTRTTDPIPDDLSLRVGQPVLMRDVAGEMHRAIVAPVPRDWRDCARNDATTTRGNFPKAWVKFKSNGQAIPWPLADIVLNPAREVS